jgi:hypothetical protein
MVRRGQPESHVQARGKPERRGARRGRRWLAPAAAWLALGGPASALDLPRAAEAPYPPPAPEDHAQAVGCLTAAIYYEAAAEPVAGRQSVAQVVLNRLRHPAFPKTVCGVVYQGAGGASGCQFTFACDGSLSRRPVPRLWNEAQAIAEAVLDGRVPSVVGEATHYHAFYVSPAWRVSMVETAHIGAHLFYRLPNPSEQGGPPGSGMFVSRPPAPAPSTFSPWGLAVATVVPSGAVVQAEP